MKLGNRARRPMKEVRDTMTDQDKARYGGQQVSIRCPECGHQLKLLDRQFIEYGPVRCGSCGAEVQGSILRRILQEAPIPGTSNPR